MSARTIKKALLFFVVDIVLIIGIFVLQFSNDSIITEKNGNLQITLSETKDNNNNTVLRNKLTLVFNGVTISCDDSKPAEIRRNGADQKESVVLENWSKTGDLEYQFDFSGGVRLAVSLSNTTEKGAVSLVTVLPSDVAEFTIPYSLASNTEVSDKSSSRILIGSKKSLWEFNASSLEDQKVSFTNAKHTASFSYFEQTVEFKFASLAGSNLVRNYETVVNSFRDSVISAYKNASPEALMNETAVVAYVAEQGSRGNYAAALEDVPQSFRRGDNRTYLSTPFFNNLFDMNRTLESELKEKDSIIRKAVNNYSLNLFTIRNIANNMYLYPNSTAIKKITETAGSAVIENTTLSEAAGILRTYVEMMGLSKAYASHMEGSLADCVNKIEKSCKMEGNNLIIEENGTFLSVVQAVEVGDALLLYGSYIGDQSLIYGGKAIIASYLGESGSFDIRTLSDLYPVVVRNNHFYPHFVKIYTSGDNVVWAWTVASDIGYERGEDRSVSFSVDFSEGDTHYVIIRGVNPFRSIYIYDVAFRTDPRFESYNSSGYVYDNNTRALLLKSRHKSEKETVRLVYAAPAAEPKPEEVSAAETAAETTAEPVEEKPAETEEAAPVEEQKQPLSQAEIRRMMAEEAARKQAEAAAKMSELLSQ